MNKSATLAFYLILEKDQPIRVLPSLLNQNTMLIKDIEELPFKIILGSTITIPSNIKPWSDISKNADHFFLMTQSRDDWGDEIDSSTPLLKIKTVKDLVVSLEESVNNHTFLNDLRSDKFSSVKKSVEPGSNWQPKI